MKPLITIDILSDVVCPWCYIGKTRLEKAIVQLTPSYDFKLQYHPFELDPGMPEDGVDQKEHLAKKFGGEIKYHEITRHTSEVAAEEGLTFDFEKQQFIPNTRIAHALIAAALPFHIQADVADAFFKAYFSRGINLTKKENLIQVAVEGGLSEEIARKTIADESAIAGIAQEEMESQQLGIRSVPFYIINNRYGISGAQPTETFVKAFREIASTAPVEER